MKNETSFFIFPTQRSLAGTPIVPSDKSVSHRRLMVASVNSFSNEIVLQSPANDVFRTIRALQQLGVVEDIQNIQQKVIIHIPKKKRFVQPEKPIDCGNSGTTARLLCGLLCSQHLSVRLIGDESLSRRPMERVAQPLRQMGAKIVTTNGCLPIEIQPSFLQGITYTLPIASAQVKSAVLFAGCFAAGITTIIEQILTRDHTERLFNILPKPVENGISLSVHQGWELPDCSGEVPLDISNLAYWIAAAILVKQSKLEWDNVLLNPTRLTYLKLLKEQGANVYWEITGYQLGEPVGFLTVESGGEFHFQLSSETVPLIIDEIPILAVLSASTNGSFEVRGAKELRFKESDRIFSMVRNLRELGIDVDEFDDGLAFEMKKPLEGGVIQSYGDHRIALAFAVAGLVAKNGVRILNADAADVSDGNFFPQLLKFI